MEEVKFWTKGKLIFIAVVIGVISIIVGSVYLYKNSVRKKYIELENQFTYAAPNYLLKEQIKLKKGQWREINIKDILKQKLVINDLASNCKGYVIANADKRINTVNYNTYLSCKNYYETENYGTKLATKNKNITKTQSQKDTIAPEIKLLGKSPMTVKLNKKYKEKGAVATDNVDGDITDKIKIKGKVDTSITGEYIITYTVSDKAHNKSTKKRKVIVKEEVIKTKDTEKPVLTFTNNTVQTICKGTKIDTSKTGVYGYSAYDDADGDITDSVRVTGDTGVINSVGEFKLEYTVSDKSDNEFKTTRTFNVKDCSQNTTVTAPTPTPSPSPSPKSSTGGGGSGRTTIVTPTPNTPSVGVSVSSMTVTPNTRNISVGSSFPITVSIFPSNATNKSVTYRSSNPAVARVDGNIVTGVGRGTAQIIVTSVQKPSVSRSCVVNVN